MVKVIEKQKSETRNKRNPDGKRELKIEY